MSDPRKHLGERDTGDKKVLVIAYAFPPCRASATYPTVQLTKYLPRFGWKPTVLTVLGKYHVSGGPEAHPTLSRLPMVVRTRQWPVVRQCRALRDGLGRVARRPRAGSRCGTDARRGDLWSVVLDLLSLPDEATGWLPIAYATGCQMLRATDFNAIYSVGPPMTAHLIGLLLKRRSRKPWVSDFHDPWATNPFWTHRSRIGASLVLRAEGAVIRNSDAVIGRTRGIANDLRLRYGTPKVQYVPCGYDPEEVEAAANLERRTSRADIVLTHTGSIHGRRRPDGLLEAVRRLSERRALGDRRLVLRFVGRRDPEAFASPAARRLAAAEQLELLPHVDHMQCLRLMSASDALVLLQDGAPRQVPAKTYEYLASCRPILALTTEGDTAELVRWAGGEVADPHEADGIAAAILRLIRARGGPADGGAGTKPGWLAAFSAAPIAEQVASVLDCLARRQAWQRVPPGDPSASDSRRGQNMAARGLAVGGRRPLRSER